VEAEGLFRRAIALRPDLPDAYFNLGTALVVQGRYAEAEAPLRSYRERVLAEPDAHGLRSQRVQALRGHARELQARGRHAEADALLAEARALESARPGRR
jgi:Flp pilus assembly protein TadD